MRKLKSHHGRPFYRIVLLSDSRLIGTLAFSVTLKDRTLECYKDATLHHLLRLLFIRNVYYKKEYKTVCECNTSTNALWGLNRNYFTCIDFLSVYRVCADGRLTGSVRHGIRKLRLRHEMNESAAMLSVHVNKQNGFFCTDFYITTNTYIRKDQNVGQIFFQCERYDNEEPMNAGLATHVL